MIDLPRRNGDMYCISPEMFAKLLADYPYVDVRSEFTKMRNWLDANPRNRKTDVHRFVINWLNRAKPVGMRVTEATSMHPSVYAERTRQPAPERREAAPNVIQSHLERTKRMLGMRV